jgi:Polysaccharide lyase
MRVLKQDLGTNPDPMSLWGDIDAVSPTRHQWFASGGPDGSPFRRMTALDGDLYHGNSERAELGDSDYVSNPPRPDTFYLYREGMHRVTSYWMRLPTDFPLYDNEHWQVVMQMKQTEPATNADGTPVISLQAIEGNWILKQSKSSGYSDNTRYMWTTPADDALGKWTHIVVDATYSSDPTKGLFQITIGGVASPVFHMYDLKKEISPPGPGLRVGDSIPSHLRLGIYHDPVMPGTHVDIADVQVFG